QLGRRAAAVVLDVPAVGLDPLDVAELVGAPAASPTACGEHQGCHQGREDGWDECRTPRHGAHPIDSDGCFGGLALRSDPDDVPGGADPLKEPDRRGRWIDLPLLHAVYGRGREGMVAVVPGLTEGRDRQPGQVPRLVSRLEVALAEHVAERVDRVRDVVQDHHPYRAPPEQPGDAGHDRAADRPTEEEGGDEPRHRPEQEGPVDIADDWVLEQVRREALFGTALRVDEEPAEVSVEKPLELRPNALPVPDVRAVGIALLIGEGVVLAVVGDPGDDRALDRGRAEHGEHRTGPGPGLEGPVGEEAMEADRDPEACRNVEERAAEQVAPAQPAARELPDDEAEHQEGDDGERASDDPVTGLVCNRLDVVRSWTARGAGSGWLRSCRRADWGRCHSGGNVRHRVSLGWS